MENDNKRKEDNARLRVWFGGDCPRCDGPVSCVVHGIAWCSAECADRAGDYCYDDARESIPKFYDESEFFALLDGLRAKGFKVVSRTDSQSSVVGIARAAMVEPFEMATADTLYEALFQAAIKAMEA